VKTDQHNKSGRRSQSLERQSIGLVEKICTTVSKRTLDDVNDENENVKETGDIDEIEWEVDYKVLLL